VQRSIERCRRTSPSCGATDPRGDLCDNQGQRDRLAELLGDTERQLGVGSCPPASRCPGAARGSHRPRDLRALRARRRRSSSTGGLSLAELSALKVGDFVVHEDHGIGTYRG
jgi:transcription-repair coupling factor (superfamily II helicase)